jgi:hypothetical protein
MRKIADIYEEYKIMPNLQMHQFRVAAVAKQVCDSFKEKIDSESIITACLLHDMGNIIKFRLRSFPDLMQNEDIDYWEKVQEDYIQRYGTDEHHATLLIAKELGIDEHILRIMDAIEFHNWSHTKEELSWENKIATYADSRVAPHGVLTLDGRLEDAVKRYSGTDRTMDEVRDALYASVREIEKEIFSHSSISSEDITDESVKEIIEELKNSSCV